MLCAGMYFTQGAEEHISLLRKMILSEDPPIKPRYLPIRWHEYDSSGNKAPLSPMPKFQDEALAVDSFEPKLSGEGPPELTNMTRSES